MQSTADVVIIGAGVAGASLAWELTRRGVARVVVVDREPRPGHHASGRSAQAFVSLKDDPLQRALVEESRAVFAAPPADLAAAPILDRTGVVLIYDARDWDAARAMAAASAARVELLGADEIARALPRPVATETAVAGAAGAVVLPDDGRLDVPRLLDGYLAGARRRGAQVVLGAEVVAVEAAGAGDRRRVTGVVTTAGAWAAPVVVNAAGAWAARVAALAGATSIALEPRRRTVVTFDPPPGVDVRGWPLVSYESAGLYYAPEAGGLLACPMDEHPVAPCDAAPDPAVVSETRTRLVAVAPVMAAARVRAARAGLRTFAPDGALVLGFDPRLPGLFWLAGQGGWGIESSPAVARVAASLVTGERPAVAGPGNATAAGPISAPDVAALSPSRFAR